jgi:tetratricopeptide (TPR) repeat protein
MNDLKYLDFDLVIEPADQGYVARVTNSPVGPAAAPFRVPFSDLEIENFLLRVGRARHVVRRIESPEMASAKTFGGRLFNEVFSGDVRGCLRSSLDEASRLGAGLRVRLRLGQVPALADLPWEFLYNSGMNRFLGLSVETPLVRYLDLPERIRPLTVKPPLRVLMMISSPSDYPKLDVGREAAKMTEALADLEKRGLVIVERQETATLAELQKRLRQEQFHIFHFIGHGGFDEQAQDGLLILEDAEERGRRVSAQFLGTLLHDHRPLRLAVLNACEGARASRTDPFAGTAQSLVQQGIPAVIAMQFEVTDEAAICFTREFYAAIAVGYPVDAALAEARKAIFAEVSEIEWGTPVLYMRSPDGCIFDVQQVSEDERQHHHISSLLTSALAADGSGDEPTAILKLKEVLKIAPGHAAAEARLRELTVQKELAGIYATARGAYDAEQWQDALAGLRRIHAIDRGYRDVEALLARAEGEVARAAEAKARQQRAADLRRAATDAGTAERWDDAVEGWRALAALAPDDPEVRTRLDDARRQLDLAKLYARGRAHYERSRWRDALAELHQVQQIAPAYRDVSVLIASIEQELERASQADRPEHRSPPYTQSPVPPPLPPLEGRGSGQTAPARAKWMVMGGLMGAVAVVGLVLLVVVIVIVMIQSDAEPDGTDTSAMASLGTPLTGAIAEPPPSNAPAAPAVTPSSVPPPPAPIETPRAPAAAEMTPALRAELQAVILRGDNAEIQAFRTLDPSPLHGVYSGEPLQNHLATLQLLREAGVFMEATLHDQRFDAFSLSSDGQRAEVRFTERWSSNFHSLALPNRPCMFHWHERDIPQTARLRREGGEWVIYASEQPSDEPQPAACH